LFENYKLKYVNVFPWQMTYIWNRPHLKPSISVLIRIWFGINIFFPITIQNLPLEMETTNCICIILIMSGVLCGNFTDQTHKLKKPPTSDWVQFFCGHPVHRQASLYVIADTRPNTAPRIHSSLYQGKYGRPWKRWSNWLTYFSINKNDKR